MTFKNLGLRSLYATFLVAAAASNVNAAAILNNQEWNLSPAVSVPQGNDPPLFDSDFVSGNTVTSFFDSALAEVVDGPVFGRAAVTLQSSLAPEVISVLGTIQTRSSADRLAGGNALYTYELGFFVTRPEDWIITGFGQSNFAFSSLQGEDGLLLTFITSDPVSTRVTLNPGVLYTVGMFGNTDTALVILPDLDISSGITLLAVPEPGMGSLMLLGLTLLAIKARQASQ